MRPSSGSHSARGGSSRVRLPASRSSFLDEPAAGLTLRRGRTHRRRDPRHRGAPHRGAADRARHAFPAALAHRVVVLNFGAKIAEGAYERALASGGGRRLPRRCCGSLSWAHPTARRRCSRAYRSSCSRRDRRASRAERRRQVDPARRDHRDDQAAQRSRCFSMRKTSRTSRRTALSNMVSGSCLKGGSCSRRSASRTTCASARCV